MAMSDAPAADPARRGAPSTTTPERVARARLAPRHGAVAVAMALLILTGTAVPVAAQSQREALEDADRATLLAMVEPFLPDEVQSSIEAAPANATDTVESPEVVETRDGGVNESLNHDDGPVDLTDNTEVYHWGGDVCRDGVCNPPCVQDPSQCADPSDRFRVYHGCRTGDCEPCTGDGCVPEEVPIGDMVQWTTTHPGKAYVGDTVTVATHLHNELPVPLLVTVEFEPKTDSVCSVESYGTSSDAMSVREHEYLLLPNGTREIGNPTPTLDDEGMFAQNLSLSVRMNVETPDATCRLGVRAVVKAAGGTEFAIGSVTPSFTTKSVPSKVAELTGQGDITVNTGIGRCHSVVPAEPPEPVEVEAGKVNVTAAMEYVTCGRDFSNFAVTQIAYDRDGDSHYDGKDETIAGTDMSDVGRTEARGQVKLSEGTHMFRVYTALLKGHYRPQCLLAAALTLGITLSVSIGQPQFASVMITPLIGSVAECGDPALAQAMYEVEVKAEDTGDNTGTDADLVGALPIGV